MTDMCDEWDDDPDEYFQRHQRRLSDPSANLNNYGRYGWKTKPTTTNEQSKALSQNEGLDSLVNEVAEIEAGDLRDGLYIIYLSKCFVFSLSFQIESQYFHIYSLIFPYVQVYYLLGFFTFLF